MHHEQNKHLRKQFGFCLHEKCCTLINHLCNLDGPLTFAREGHVFPVKDKSGTLTSIIKDSSTAWLSEERSHQLTTWSVADANRNSQQFWMLITKQVIKAGTGSWEQSWMGKTLSPGSLHSLVNWNLSSSYCTRHSSCRKVVVVKRKPSATSRISRVPSALRAVSQNDCVLIAPGIAPCISMSLPKKPQYLQHFNVDLQFSFWSNQIWLFLDVLC